MATSTDRHELQRQALAQMLARFTADRDALITAVQACQERLTKVMARLDGGEVPAGPDAGSGEATAAPAAAFVDELRNSIMQLRLDQDMAIAHACAAAEQATERADEALRRAKEMEARLEEMAVLLRQRKRD
jgi:hypothetical protein